MRSNVQLINCSLRPRWTSPQAAAAADTLFKLRQDTGAELQAAAAPNWIAVAAAAASMGYAAHPPAYEAMQITRTRNWEKLYSPGGANPAPPPSPSAAGLRAAVARRSLSASGGGSTAQSPLALQQRSTVAATLLLGQRRPQHSPLLHFHSLKEDAVRQGLVESSWSYSPRATPKSSILRSVGVDIQT